MKTHLPEIKKGTKCVLVNSGGVAIEIATVYEVTTDGYAVSSKLRNTTVFFEPNKARTCRPYEGYTLSFDVQKGQHEIETREAKAKAEYAAEMAFRETPEYKAAAEFVNSAYPEESIAALARLGMSKLRQIKEWLEATK